jgi:hypothetical protein
LITPCPGWEGRKLTAQEINLSLERSGADAGRRLIKLEDAAAHLAVVA